MVYNNTSPGVHNPHPRLSLLIGTDSLNSPQGVTLSA